MNHYYFNPPKEYEDIIDYKSWVGGNWDQFGKLYLNFLISQGLNSQHKVLDVGCGCLRGGVKLIQFLNKNNYYGQDINEYLVRMGLEKEVPKYQISDKICKENFCISNDFTLFFQNEVKFDIGISQSVFTHLPLNHLYLCLLNIKDYFKIGAKFFVTFWIISDEKEINNEYIWDGIKTTHINDPYHYKKSQIESVAKDSLISEFWDYFYIGEWGHPRHQKMFCFIKK